MYLMATPVKYFTYGSNMDKGDLDVWCKRRGYSLINFPAKPNVTVLDGWELVFNYCSSTRGGGAANIMQAGGKAVYGIMLGLSSEEYEKIAEKEGWKKDNPEESYYEPLPVSVKLVSGGFVESAITFKVLKKREEETFQTPTRPYRDLILNAAKRYGFPKWYTEMLEKIPVK